MSASPLSLDELLAEGGIEGCCSSIYESEPVRWLLDGQLHPGGKALTRRVAQLAGIGAGDRVLDVASGAGTTARMLAGELGARVVGVELGAGAVAGAAEAAARAGADNGVSFVQGDAQSLAFADSSFDAIVCECSVCLFDDKPVAAREMARVLRPGGRLALSDVTADIPGLPPQLRSAAAQVACVADALTASGYEGLLRDAGLTVETTEPHDDALEAMVDRVEARLKVARMLALPELEPFRDQNQAAIELAGLARQAAADGLLGYSVFVARAEA